MKMSHRGFVLFIACKCPPTFCLFCALTCTQAHTHTHHTLSLSLSLTQAHTHIHTQESRLLHYHEKSVEEWLVKMEQSIAPFKRYLSDYAAACQTQLSPTTYDPEYTAVMHDVMRGLRETKSVDDGGIFLGSLPELGEEFFMEAEEHYALYRFIKARVAQGVDWDEESYLKQHPELMDEEEKGRHEKADDFVDGLHHFLGQRSLQEAGEKCCWSTV